jgi:hypothetical protein
MDSLYPFLLQDVTREQRRYQQHDQDEQCP